MTKKITLLTLCSLGFFAFNSAYTQEGGAPEKTDEDVIEVARDSSLVFQESMGTDELSEPVATPFNVPFNSVKKETPKIENPTEPKINQEGDQVAKEPKQEFSFNIIYYLIYKFKQVDNQ